jgi:DivIVA domain-containing protein
MALTPEDVVNKRFQSTKFRDGYDQDEVDDFLDEVVVEMRRLVEENESLKAELEAATQAPPAEASPASTPAAPAAAVFTDDPIDAEGTTNLLQLARRLHEEHVREGIQRRDELIAEGHAQASRIVEEAEDEHARKMEIFARERTAAETQIEELRDFEREYRQSLRGFIETQLNTLEGTGVEASIANAPSTDPQV